MNFLINKILDPLKDIIIQGILYTFKGLSIFNEYVGNSISEVGSNPKDFNSELFNIAKTVNENVVVPIAGIIITFIAVYEIYNLFVEKNNLHDVESVVFFKWVLKTFISIYLVTNSFNFVMGIFEMTQNMASSTNQIQNIDMFSNLDVYREALRELNFMELLEMWLYIIIIAFVTNILAVLVWVVVIGRMIEMYFIISASALPFATLTSGRYGSIGDSYIKSAVAIGLQGMFIILTFAFYNTYISDVILKTASSGTLFLKAMPLKILGTSILTVYTMFKTKSLANAIINA